jgi:hypothetical protein
MKFVLGMIVVGVLFTEIARAAAPASAPTSAPSAELLAEITRLSSNDFKVRQEAQEKIVGMGAGVIPALQEAGKKADDPEVRTAAEAIIDRIIAADQTGASLVTLHYTNAHPREVIADLAKQGHTELPAWPDSMWDNMQVKPVSIDVDRQPFWLVAREVCKKANVRLQSMGMNEGLTVMQGSDNAMGGVAVTEGPFMVVATSASAGQSVTYGTPEQVSMSMSLNLTFFVEPKVRLLGREWQPDVTELTDEKGKSWLDPAARQRQAQMNPTHGREVTWSANIDLKRPADGGRKIATIKGNFRVMVPAKTETIVVEDVLKAKNVMKGAAGRRIEVKSVTRQGDQYNVKLTVFNDNPAPPPLAFQNGLMVSDQFDFSQIKLIDAEGKSLTRGGGGGGGSRERQDFEYSFSSGRSGGKTGEPAKLVWEIATEVKQVSVPFEFHDLKLPPPPP